MDKKKKDCEKKKEVKEKISSCECENKEENSTCKEKCECENEKVNSETEEQKIQTEVEELKKEIEKLQENVKDLEDKNLREKAELINFKKRKEEEVGRIIKYSSEDIVKDMLPIIDNFERAIKMDDDNLEDEVSKFLEGFKMIYCDMNSIFEKHEVKAIDGANKPFDPVYHQAVLTEKSENMESGMVIEVLQKGYMLKDRVIRPAMVKVSE